MFRKLLVIVVVLLLAMPCIGDAGLKDKIKDKAKSTAKDAADKTKGAAKNTAGGVVQQAGSTAHKATTVPSGMAKGGAQIVKPVSGKAGGAIESGAKKISGAGAAVDKKAHSVGERIKD